MKLSASLSPERRSILTCCRNWCVPASTTFATRGFGPGTSRLRWATRATGWSTGVTELQASSTCSSWPTRWSFLMCGCQGYQGLRSAIIAAFYHIIACFCCKFVNLIAFCCKKLFFLLESIKLTRKCIYCEWLQLNKSSKSLHLVVKFQNLENKIQTFCCKIQTRVELQVFIVKLWFL